LKGLIVAIDPSCFQRIRDKYQTRMDVLVDMRRERAHARGRKRDRNTRQERDTKARTYKLLLVLATPGGRIPKFHRLLILAVAGRVQVVFPRVRKAKRLLSTKDWAITYQTIEL